MRSLQATQRIPSRLLLSSSVMRSLEIAVFSPWPILVLFHFPELRFYGTDLLNAYQGIIKILSGQLFQVN
jgi:hypothetical protein